MKLSEYIQRLQKIQRTMKRAGLDPEVAVSRYSDFTTDLTPGWENNDDDYPRVVYGLPATGQEWITRAHEKMTDEQKARLEPYVELLSGN